MASKKAPLSDGDWICADSSCGNVNFTWRTSCNKCGKEKGKVDIFKKTGQEVGKTLASKSGGLFSADDWQCSKCGNINWARRNECNICNEPKFGKVEARTGAGGGYNERENVEYIERTESDDEFDEFGRKKKKFRKIVNVEQTVSPKATSEQNNGANKSNEIDVDSDEGSNDESDEDIAKYDLFADLEEPSHVNTSSSISSHFDGTTSRRKKSRSRSHSNDGGPRLLSKERDKRSLSRDTRSRSRDRRSRSRDRRSRSRDRGRRSRRSRSRERNRRSRSRDRDRNRRSRSRDRDRRSRSRDRDRRSRSRDRDRRSRSRDRDRRSRSRDRDRSRSRDRDRRSRSRDRDRRSRDRDRDRRSRSRDRDRRSRSRDRDWRSRSRDRDRRSRSRDRDRRSRSRDRDRRNSRSYK